ncbi:MAG: YhcH/YjgK/YiaL family protein [Gemmatimonadota bacterium]|nr:YhcH/YjgK/YiaL family protein [Gemmatimonadota bacterium]
MILDSLDAAERYEQFGPGFVAGLHYLRTFDPSTPDGRHPVSGDGLFALVQSYDTGRASAKRFESHRRHVDIQYVVSGTERILHVPTGLLSPETPYNEEDDILFYEDPEASSSLLLRVGDLAIFHPADAHKPGCMAGRRSRVKKVVVKVPLGHGA